MVLCVCQELLGKKIFYFCACFCLTNLSVCVMLGEQGALGPSALLRRACCVAGGRGPCIVSLSLAICRTPTYCICFTEKKNPGGDFREKIFLKETKHFGLPLPATKSFSHFGLRPHPLLRDFYKKGDPSPQISVLIHSYKNVPYHSHIIL